MRKPQRHKKLPKLRVMIVDDEPLAREGLKELLAGEPDIVVCGECEDGVRAMEAILKKKPDLVFLDIQMPEFDGFDVIKAVGPDAMPAVIFVTAFDEYALRAFEVHALDYLLKPVDPGRLEVALDRVRGMLLQKDGGRGGVAFEDRLESLLVDLSRHQKFLERVLVKIGGRIILLRVDDVDWIEAQRDYICLHVAGKKHLLRETIARMESQLDPGNFIRVHRSTIVNLNRVKELHPLYHGDYAVVLTDGTRVTLSRRYRERVFAAVRQTP